MESAWFVRLTASSLRGGGGGGGENETPARLSSLGIRLRRVSHVKRAVRQQHWRSLTYPCGRVHLDAALDLLSAKTGSGTRGGFRTPIISGYPTGV